MNGFGVHIRDTIRLDQAFVDSLPKQAGLPWTFVARVVTFAGATIADRTVTIIAGEVRGEAPLTLRNSSTAPALLAGTPGPPLTVICEHLFACSAHEQRRARRQGRDGREGRSAPRRGPPRRATAPGPGGEGGKGKKGKQGHPRRAAGRSPSPPSPSTAAPRSCRRAATAAKAATAVRAGPAAPASRRGSQGPPGDKGDPGPKGPNGAVFVGQLTMPFRQELVNRGIATPWARFRAEQAQYLFRIGNLTAARNEALAVQAIEPGDSDAEALLRLLREHRTITGPERDLEVDNDANLFARTHRDAARALRDKLFTDGAVLFGSSDKHRWDEAVRDVNGALQAAGAAFDRQEDARSEREVRAKAIADEAVLAISALRVRILADVAPTAVVGGSNARALADAIGRLGFEGGGAGGLLPAAPDLLVDAARLQAPPLTDTEVAALSAGAVGLVAPPGWEGVTVNLRKVADGLRAATGDATAKALLVELVDLVHRWRLAVLREHQAKQAKATLAARRAEIKPALDKLPMTGYGDAKLAAVPVLRGVRCLLDAHRWDVLRAERSVALYTHGLGFSDSDEDNQPLATSEPVFFSPAIEKDVEEGLMAIGETFFDPILAAVGARDLRGQVSRYEARGERTELIGVVRRFDRASHPAVFARLAKDGTCWIDVSVNELKHSEAKFAGAEISLGGVQSAERSFAVTLTHGGIARQRVLGDGTLRDQTQLPASLTVPVTRVADGFYAGEAVEAPAPYGRGAAAGYRLAIDTSVVDLSALQALEIKILCEGFLPAGAIAVRKIEHPPLRAGTTSYAVITLTDEAPAGGLKVNVGSTDATVVRTPASVTVPAGARTATVALEALRASGPVPPELTAVAADGTIRRVFAPVAAAVAPVTRTLDPGAVGALAVGGERLFACLAPASKAAPPSVHALRLGLERGPAAPFAAIPRSVAVDRGHAFVVRGTGVATLDATEPVLAGLVAAGEADLGADPFDVAVGPDGRVYAGTAVLKDGVKLATLPGVAAPRALAFSGDSVYVLHGAKSLSQVRRKPDGSYAMVKTIELPVPGVDVAVDGAFIAVAATSELIRLRFNALTVLDRVPIAARAVAASDGIAYAVGAGGLHLLAIQTGRLLLTVPAGGKPCSVAVHDGVAYVGDESAGTVTRIACPTEFPLKAGVRRGRRGGAPPRPPPCASARRASRARRRRGGRRCARRRSGGRRSRRWSSPRRRARARSAGAS